jgi:hypothetical protein
MQVLILFICLLSLPMFCVNLESGIRHTEEGGEGNGHFANLHGQYL